MIGNNVVPNAEIRLKLKKKRVRDLLGQFRRGSILISFLCLFEFNL